jgi:hypothetical protein
VIIPRQIDACQNEVKGECEGVSVDGYAAVELICADAGYRDPGDEGNVEG